MEKFGITLCSNFVSSFYPTKKFLNQKTLNMKSPNLKSIITLGLVLALQVFAVQSATASNNEPSVSLKEAGQKTFVLVLDYPAAKKVDIVLKDLYNVILLREETEVNGHLAKKYNLNALPSGNYFLEIEDEQSILVYNINIEREKVTVSNVASSKIFKPSLTQKDDKVTVDMLLLNLDNVVVSILDADNQVLLEEKAENVVRFGKVYDLSELKAGNYTFKIRAANRTFYNKISL